MIFHLQKNVFTKKILFNCLLCVIYDKVNGLLELPLYTLFIFVILLGRLDSFNVTKGLRALLVDMFNISTID